MQTRLILFAKAPIAGYAKTRLIPALGSKAAAQFHRGLVVHSLTTLCNVRGGRVELHYSEPHPFFWRLARRFDCQLKAQTSGNLGQKMLHALRQEQTPGMIIGSDCPIIRPRLVERCRQALVGSDLVLLPAEDGGYGLIGCRRPQDKRTAQLFNNIPWGTEQVLEHTRIAATSAQLQLIELDTIWDIDTPDDWRRWQQTKMLHEDI